LLYKRYNAFILDNFRLMWLKTPTGKVRRRRIPKEWPGKQEKVKAAGKGLKGAKPETGPVNQALTMVPA
jgi:hypothetical protein